MKIIKIVLIGSLILLQSAGISYSQDNNNRIITTNPQKLGYALGVEMGRSLLKMNPDIELKALLDGVRDAYLNHSLSMPKKDVADIKQTFRQKRFKVNKINQIRKKKIMEEEKKSPEERAAKKPAYNFDFSMVDQTSAEKAAWSFIILYNNIMPVYTEKHFKEICTILATNNFQGECENLLADRLIAIKKEVETIKKGSFWATFSKPDIVQLPSIPNGFEISWIETFSPQDKSKTYHNKKLQIKMLQVDSKWKIKSAEFIQE